MSEQQQSQAQGGQSGSVEMSGPGWVAGSDTRELLSSCGW